MFNRCSTMFHHFSPQKPQLGVPSTTDSMSKRDCWKWVRKVAAPNSRSPSRAATLPTRLLSKTSCIGNPNLEQWEKKNVWKKCGTHWKNVMILIMNGIEWVSGEASSAKLRGLVHNWPYSLIIGGRKWGGTSVDHAVEEGHVDCVGGNPNKSAGLTQKNASGGT